jgi:hypothetical protein
VVGEECTFGCFFPRAMSCLSPQPAVSTISQCEDIVVIMALFMPKLHELCGEPYPSTPMSVVHQQVDSLGISNVASTPPPVDLS